MAGAAFIRQEKSLKSCRLGLGYYGLALGSMHKSITEGVVYFKKTFAFLSQSLHRALWTLIPTEKRC